MSDSSTENNNITSQDNNATSCDMVIIENLSKNSVRTELLDLNEDCLLEILSYLSVAKRVDLIGTLCKRMDDIAYTSISKYKHLNLNFREGTEFSVRHLKIIARNLLCINISAGYSINSCDVLKILHPIMETALDNPLKELTLNYIIFNESYMQCLCANVANICKLDLSFSQITDELLEPILNNCKRLQELRIIGNYSLNGSSLRCTTVANLSQLVVEKHENWVFEFTNPDFGKSSILCIVFEKGRAAFKEFRFNVQEDGRSLIT